MVRRPLGRTGLSVTPIGFGAFKIGRNQAVKYPAGYDLPDDAASATLLRGVVDAGIAYIDTAPAYGLSEERIGAALASRRSELVLSTKVGERFEAGRSTYDFSARAVRDSVERSCRLLRCDVLDVVFIHAHREDLGVLADTPAAATLAELKREGRVRAVGFSGKTVAAARRALELADVLMVEYHLNDRSHAEVIAEAGRRGVGVVVKKGLDSGRLPPADAIPFVLGTEGVSSLVIGGLSLAHVRDNLAYAS
ncbi:MAG TPA: aldo/keto reductase [Haliangiales bacterium]|nr:aldo/keto reductase [Haliangiales bacterium]